MPVSRPRARLVLEDREDREDHDRQRVRAQRDARAGQVRLQDVDYLTLAAAKDPARVKAIVDRIVPKVLWEVQCHDPVADCSYCYAPVRWSADPDVWEAARAELASILDGG